MGRSVVLSDQLDSLCDEMDLRRKQDNSAVDLIVQRADLLEPSDRELVYAMFRDGKSASTIATLVGQCPRSIRRQIKKLVQRLNDPCFHYVVTNTSNWGRTRSAVARSLYIQGRSMRQATQELGMSFHCVRKHREAIEAMAQASLHERSQINRAWKSINGSY